MDYIKVRSLKEYQHYTDRSMVWFKWHINCLADYKFSRLFSHQKWLFVGLICLACKLGNKIPLDYDWIKSQIGYENSTIKEDIKTLLASEMLAICYQNACLDKNRIDKNRIDKIAEQQSAPPFLVVPKETSTTKECCLYFGNKYKQKFGFEYPFTWAKDMALMKDMIKSQKDNKKAILDCIDIFFEKSEKSDEWHKDKITIGVFKVKFPFLLIDLSKEIKGKIK